VIQQPLSDLAVEIIKEALASDGQQFVFESPMYKGQPIHRKAMADALRGTKHETNKDKTKTAGLCELLGSSRSRPMTCAGRQRPWPATSASTTHGLRSASTTPRARRPSRSCRRSPAKCTITPSG